MTQLLLMGALVAMRNERQIRYFDRYATAAHFRKHARAGCRERARHVAHGDRASDRRSESAGCDLADGVGCGRPGKQQSAATHRHPALRAQADAAPRWINIE